MKKILFFMLFFSFFYTTNANNYIQTKVEGITIKAVEYDINSKYYDIEVLRTGTGEELPLSDILDQNNAITGVNGNFFCPSDYSFCAGKEGTTNNEVYVNGDKFSFWPTTDNRVVFAWDENNNPFLYQDNKINQDNESDIDYGLSNRPLLLLNGEEQTEYYRDYGLIDDKMKVNSTRNFICTNEKKNKIYFGLVYGVNIDKLAYILKGFGCYDAINLDAGLSTAFIYNGRYLVGPQRPIINAVGIVPKFSTDYLNNLSITISDRIGEYLESKDVTLRLKYTDNLLKQFKSYRTEIYTKYSSDLYDDDGNYLGYEIKMNNQKALKLVYLLNKTYYLLAEKREEYQTELDEYNAKIQEKIEQNKKNLLDGVEDESIEIDDEDNENNEETESEVQDLNEVNDKESDAEIITQEIDSSEKDTNNENGNTFDNLIIESDSGTGSLESNEVTNEEESLEIESLDIDDELLNDLENNEIIK